MKLSDLNDTFSSLRKLITRKSTPVITELVFFKCYVMFEGFICDLFSDYAIGTRNERNYIPKTRELQFKDKDTLDRFLKLNKTYTEYFKLAEENADLFFSPDPFAILKDPVYGHYLLEMKLIRNVVAHNSQEAIGRYTKTVLNGSSYIAPGIFLNNLMKGTKTKNLDNYLKCMLEMAEKALVV